MEKLGIIAGAGELPVLLARAAVAHDREPVVIQITKSDAERFVGLHTKFIPTVSDRFKRLHEGFSTQV